ncbi:MAG: dihydrofolate reductase [Proteobacteria bacterium]|nr:dihydrofolate reductase [Pseudomonadota bacterium]
MQVVLVVAVARNGVIGRGGDMPWRMPSSLRRFRALTMGRPMVMGRKTFQSIGKPLDGRDTIIVTRQREFQVAGAHTVGDLAAALRLGQQLAQARGSDEIVIAGGGEIYVEALPYATRIDMDEIDAAPDGDTRFARLDPAEWREARREPVERHPKDDHGLTAVTFVRRSPPRPLPPA